MTSAMPAVTLLARSPLQVVVFGDLADSDVKEYQAALTAAFNGSVAPVGYVPAGDDLGVQLTIYDLQKDIAPKPEDLAKGFLNILVIVLITDSVAKSHSSSFGDWILSFWKMTELKPDRFRILPLALDERQTRSFTKIYSLDAVQIDQAFSYGERAVRSATFAVRALHEARLLLAPATGTKALGNHLRLFVSHAKLDGLPLARALKSQIEEIPALKTFYDVESIPPGTSWAQELESGVRTSVIIMLRTEVYDQRHWCQQEVLWAEEYATPAVLVEARTGLAHATSPLPFDRVPTVRIPDGNLLRIVFLAIREGLRFMHFMVRIEELKHTGEIPANAVLRVFCFPPSMTALLKACRELKTVGGRRPKFILYPDPVLRRGQLEAAEALVAQHKANIKLLTPLSLIAAHAAKAP